MGYLKLLQRLIEIGWLANSDYCNGDTDESRRAVQEWESGRDAELTTLRAEVERLTEANRAMNEAIDGDVFGAEVMRLKAELERLIDAGKVLKFKADQERHSRSLLEAELSTALRERDEWKAKAEWFKTVGIVELMGENVNVDSYVREWETRCLKAEKELAEAREALANICPRVSLTAVQKWGECGQRRLGKACEYFRFCRLWQSPIGEKGREG